MGKLENDSVGGAAPDDALVHLSQDATAALAWLIAPDHASAGRTGCSEEASAVLEPAVAEIRTRLEGHLGFAVVRGLPTPGRDADSARRLALEFGRLLARRVQ